MQIAKTLLSSLKTGFAPILLPNIVVLATNATSGRGSGLLNSYINHEIREHAKPAIGSIVFCSLGFSVEHTGVYVGNGEFVELHGSGQIKKVSYEQFLRGSDDGFPVRTGLSIYVACDGLCALGCHSIASRATEMVGTSRSYNLILDNCHQFTAGCISGNFDNANNFFWMVEDLIEQELNYGNSINWRVLDL